MKQPVNIVFFGLWFEEVKPVVVEAPRHIACIEQSSNIMGRDCMHTLTHNTTANIIMKASCSINHSKPGKLTAKRLEPNSKLANSLPHFNISNQFALTAFCLFGFSLLRKEIPDLLAQALSRSEKPLWAWINQKQHKTKSFLVKKDFEKVKRGFTNTSRKF